MYLHTIITLFACAVNAGSSALSASTQTTSSGHKRPFTTISAGDSPITTRIPAHTETFSATIETIPAPTHVVKKHNLTITHKDEKETKTETKVLKQTTHIHAQTVKTKPASTRSYPAATVTIKPKHKAVLYSGAGRLVAETGVMAVVIVAGAFAML